MRLRFGLAVTMALIVTLAAAGCDKNVVLGSDPGTDAAVIDAGDAADAGAPD